MSIVVQSLRHDSCGQHRGPDQRCIISREKSVQLRIRHPLQGAGLSSVPLRRRLAGCQAAKHVWTCEA